MPSTRGTTAGPLSRSAGCPNKEHPEGHPKTDCPDDPADFRGSFRRRQAASTQGRDPVPTR
jgi:hypothetical protein